MKGRQLIFLLIFFLFACKCYSQGVPDELLRQLVRQTGQAEVVVTHLQKNDLDSLSIHTSVDAVKDGFVKVIISQRTVEWFISRHYNYSISERRQIRSAEIASNVNQALQWDAWPKWSQYDSIMKKFASDYPSLCRLDTIGTSIYGKPVYVLKISDNPGTDEDEPEVFYSSTIHGDEPEGYVLMLRFCDYLMKNYNTSAGIHNLVDNLEIWINPLANPDGTYGRREEMFSPAGARPTRFNALFYDLNRNFPDPLQPYSSSNVMQKETASMIGFMRKRHFVLSANFHSGAEIVNYPWDRWLTKYHADDAWFHSISRSYADTVHHYSSPGYMSELDNGVTRGAAWYVIYGGRQDFITWELQGREVTIELSNTKLVLPSTLPALWQYNYRSLLKYLEEPLAGIHGKVITGSNQKPVAAMIYIKGHDKDSSQVYSDSLSGNFVRMLTPGAWDLTFTAKGYRDTIVTGVNVIQFQRTDLQMEMIPWKITIPKEGETLLFPNPASSEIRAMLPKKMEGEMNICIYNTSGALLLEYNTSFTAGVPLKIFVGKLTRGFYIIHFRNLQNAGESRASFIKM